MQAEVKNPLSFNIAHEVIIQSQIFREITFIERKIESLINFAIIFHFLTRRKEIDLMTHPKICLVSVVRTYLVPTCSTAKTKDTMKHPIPPMPVNNRNNPYPY